MNVMLVKCCSIDTFTRYLRAELVVKRALHVEKGGDNIPCSITHADNTAFCKLAHYRFAGYDKHCRCAVGTAAVTLKDSHDWRQRKTACAAVHAKALAARTGGVKSDRRLQRVRLSII
jgi:hypothetical protein